MSILCRLGRHVAPADVIWNSGVYFGKCRRCDRDTLGRGDVWRSIPKGYRVVWRDRRAKPEAHFVPVIARAPARVSDLVLSAPSNEASGVSTMVEGLRGSA